MTNLTAQSRLGELNNNNADDYALFLKVFSGEVLTALEERLVMSPNITVRTISGGDSAQFPATGLATAKHHEAGQSLYTTGSYLDVVNHAELEIFADRPLIGGPIAIDSWDELVNHYDVRGPYARAIAQALAKTIDQRSIQAGILGARAAATVSGLAAGTSGGGALTNANMFTSGADLLTALFRAQVVMDNNNVDDMDRFFVCSPQQYSNLVQNQDLLNRDFGGANGVFADGTVWKAAGFTLLKSNRVDAIVALGNVVADPAGLRNSLIANYTNFAGLCFHKSAIGKVQWAAVTSEVEKSMEYQATIVLSKVTCGQKYLRPEALVELKIA